MIAGRLDRYITLQRRGAGDDGYSSDGAGEWVTVERDVPASFKPGGGSEGLAAGQTIATAPAVFEIRWSEPLAEVGGGWRLLFDGREWDIKGAAELGRRDGISITAVRERP